MSQPPDAMALLRLLMATEPREDFSECLYCGEESPNHTAACPWLAAWTYCQAHAVCQHEDICYEAPVSEAPVTLRALLQYALEQRRRGPTFSPE